MSEYSDQLRIENTNLEAEIKKKETDLRIYDRVNEYYSQDEVMVVYIQKMLTILYIVIYFFFIYFLYSSQYSRLTSIFYLIIFAILPFVLHIISRFLYTVFLQVLHLFNNGNAAYLYVDSA
jgi:hypothetical protein